MATLNTLMTPEARDEWRTRWKLVMASAMGASMATIAIGSLGIFIVPLEAAFGWTRAEISSGFLMYAVVGIVFAPLLGGLLDRWGPRWFAVPGVLYGGAAFAMFGTATGSTTQWMVLWFFFSIGGLITKPLLWSTAISKSFTSSRGIALAVMYIGSSLGGMTTPLLASFLVDTLGWRLAYAVMGLGWGGLACVVCYFFFHMPAGATTAARSKSAAAKNWSDVGKTLTSATFLKMFAGTLIGCTFVMGVYIHLVPVLGSVGLSKNEALLAVSLCNAGGLVSKFLGGFLADRVRGNLLTAAGALLPTLAYASLLVPTEFVVLRLIPVAIFGVSVGGIPILMSYIVSRYFNLATYGTVFGVIFSAMAIALGVGPVLAGYVYDRTHSYDGFLIASLVAAVVAAMLFVSLGRYPDEVREASEANVAA